MKGLLGNNLVHLDCSDRCVSGRVIKCFLAITAAVEAAARATCHDAGGSEREHGHCPFGEGGHKRGADHAGEIEGGVKSGDVSAKCS